MATTSVWIGALKNRRAKALLLANRKITDVPPELTWLVGIERLVLKNNSITALPTDLCALTKVCLTYVC